MIRIANHGCDAAAWDFETDVEGGQLNAEYNGVGTMAA